MKKKRGRPLGRRPVLAMRVSQALYDELADVASCSGKSVSEEASLLLERKMFRRRQPTVPLMVRFPTDVHRLLVAHAHSCEKSLNETIIDICRQVIPQPRD